MSRKGKVIVAMSGGVDSSVVACLLKEQGYDCVGVYLRVGMHMPNSDDADPRENVAAAENLKLGCCSPNDADDARAIAGKLGIPFHVLNFERHFTGIIDYFVDEYARGRTPNPCVMCNRRLKFGQLLKFADTQDAEFIATGHYARVPRRDGRIYLARSASAGKDQTYVLCRIRRENLARCIFPLGEIEDKTQVRAVASELGLRVHDKPESQEICFVQNNGYRELVRQRRPETMRPGEVQDSAGKVLGQHDGVAFYTIGQRRGLGIAAGIPIYVTKLDAASNIVTAGPREELLSPGLIADQINWLCDREWLQDQPETEIPNPAFRIPNSEFRIRQFRAEIKIRYMHTPAPGSIRVLENGDVEARFDQPQPAVTPGQAAVFYRRDGIVLGGGWIRESLK